VSAPQTCAGCGKRPVAFKGNKYCFKCRRPGRGPRQAPPCRRCGSVQDYYSAGLCARCHQYAPQGPQSCRDCLAFGVRRLNGYLCRRCFGWRQKHPEVAPCAVCGEDKPIGRGRLCRLCWQTASDAHVTERRLHPYPYRPLDVFAANRHGQQLFFADMPRKSEKKRAERAAAQRQFVLERTGRRLPAPRQLDLFDQPISWNARRGLPEPSSRTQAERLQALARNLAGRHGWSKTATNRVCRMLLAALAVEQNPGGKVRASTVERLKEIETGAGYITMTVLEEAGMLEDDRVPAIEAWFERQIEGLPPEMASELRVWFDVMRNGSTTPPRSKPRANVTIRVRVRWMLPTLRRWAEEGCQSLREVSKEDVRTALPPSGNPRATLGAALRSLFKVLKGRGLVFVNPTTGIRTGSAESRQPLPVDVEVIKAGIDSDDPARAALTALLAFHALRPSELRNLKLMDICDGVADLAGRGVPLAPLVQKRVRAYIDYRNRRWPKSANPHVFLNHRTATRTVPVGSRWLGLTLGVAARTLREDRILDEVHATGGDLRRVHDFFGLSIQAAGRYVATLDAFEREA
jgi:integrase